MGYILIVHAQDIAEVVAGITRSLRENELDCLTVKEKIRILPPGSIIIRELENIVASASAVLVFASPGLSLDFTALSLLDYSAVQGNLLGVTLPDLGRFTIPPSFLKAFDILNLENGSLSLASQILPHL